VIEGEAVSTDNVAQIIQDFAEAVTPPAIRPFRTALESTALLVFDDSEHIIQLIALAAAGNRVHFQATAEAYVHPITGSRAKNLYDRFRDVIAERLAMEIPERLQELTDPEKLRAGHIYFRTRRAEEDT
jgi:hypothetical protein